MAMTHTQTGNGMTVEVYRDRQERDARGRELRKQGFKTHKSSKTSRSWGHIDTFEITWIDKSKA